jgi:hypothetical protein
MTATSLPTPVTNLHGCLRVEPFLPDVKRLERGKYGLWVPSRQATNSCFFIPLPSTGGGIEIVAPQGEPGQQKTDIETRKIPQVEDTDSDKMCGRSTVHGKRKANRSDSAKSSPLSV